LYDHIIFFFLNNSDQGPSFPNSQGASTLSQFIWKQKTKEHRSWQTKEHLPTILPSHLWSFQLYLASTLGCTRLTEYRNKTQKHGMLLVGYIQRHNQAALLSCIIMHNGNFSPKQTNKKSREQKERWRRNSNLNLKERNASFIEFKTLLSMN